ncbi:hypothetical protein [Colwellia psychrerythraea]|nr:hypothetical protein [Colwellia psychrerythraea]
MNSVKLLLIACLLGASFFTKVSLASDYYLNEVAEFTFGESTEHQWLAPLPNPLKNKQYFIGSQLGDIFLITGDTILSEPILDLSRSLQLFKKVKLTALAVHPNFKFSDRSGYATLYTAHTEGFNKKNNLSRLKPLNSDINYKYDAVITQWRYDHNQQKVFISSQREVLRLALPDNSISITQLAFNPSSKPWQEDYGLLYIALSNSEKIASESLYSGAILRINPDKESSESDPSQENNSAVIATEALSEVLDEVIFLQGGQKIFQFFWPEKYPDKLLVAHEYNLQRHFSLAAKGQDWRKQLPSFVARQNDIPAYAITGVLYQGSEFSHLYGKLLSIQKKGGAWHLTAMSLAQQKGKQLPAQIIWSIDPSLISSLSQISLHTTHHGEPVLFNHSDNLLYALTSNQVKSAEIKNKNKIEINTYYFAKKIAQQISIGRVLLVIMLFIIWFLVKSQLKSNSPSLKGVLDNQLTSFKFNELEQSVSLFRHHNQNADIKLSLAEIKQSEVYLNKVVIMCINAQYGHDFDHAHESDLRNSFSKEHHDQMKSEETRRIELHLIDKMDNEYAICLYLRQGNQRATKCNYDQVIEDLVDWCWLLSKCINPQND